MKKKIKQKEVQQLKERDFIKEYYELLVKFGIDIDTVNYRWHENSGHIKRFSLLEKTPTPILTDSTIIINR